MAASLQDNDWQRVEEESFITGDFFSGHLEEFAEGKFFALEKPNAGGATVDARGIVIGSTWR